MLMAAEGDGTGRPFGLTPIGKHHYMISAAASRRRNVMIPSVALSPWPSRKSKTMTTRPNHRELVALNKTCCV